MVVRIKTSWSEESVRDLINRIPKIISGDEPDEHGIRKVYSKVFLQELLSQIHEAYLVKSKGGEDNLGNSWPPIKQSTKYGKANKKLLQGISNVLGAEASANKRDLIMIETGLILRSLTPSKSGYRKYQIAKYENGKFTVGTEVEYAKYHENSRPVIPHNIEPWVEQASNKAMEAVVEHLEKIL